jgi:putative endonuclease
LHRAIWRSLKQLADRLRRAAEQPYLSLTQSVGRHGEDLAHRFLEARGYVIVARNWMPPGQSCEIDLVARDGAFVVFVEVKTRRSTEYGDPERNVHRIKHLAMRRGAFWYMRVHHVPEEQVRFDLVTVVLRDPPEISHYVGFGALRDKPSR